MATLLGRLCGYYEATPLMARAAPTTWLRPDIEIGSKFTYAPFRDGVNWDFYIEKVMHSYVFGGPSKTQLTLSRGLPSSIYNDSSSTGLLYNIHIGNAQRVGGVYKIGLPSGSAAPLTAVPPKQFSDWMISLDTLYVTPQGVSATP